MSSDHRASRPAPPEVDGTGVRVALVCGRFNDLVTERLLAGALDELAARGTAQEDVTVAWVPGAFEIPLAAKALAEAGRHDAVVALGAVIRGETAHFDHVAGQCARGIQEAQLATGVPIVFGVLTTENLEQALDRSGGTSDVGEESARTALEMVGLLREIRASAPD